MRLKTPRLAPLEREEWDEETAAVVEPFANNKGDVFNIFKTLAHHPDLLRRWRVFANHVLGKSTLNERDRELLILRIGYLCNAEYEWAQHVAIGRRVGITDSEIADLKAGSSAQNWSERDRLLLKAAEELHDDAFISDATWDGLSKHYNKQQLIDIVFTVGQYNMVSMALNTLGVQLDKGLRGFDG